MDINLLINLKLCLEMELSDILPLFSE